MCILLNHKKLKWITRKRILRNAKTFSNNLMFSKNSRLIFSQMTRSYLCWHHETGDFQLSYDPWSTVFEFFEKYEYLI